MLQTKLYEVWSEGSLSFEEAKELYQLNGNTAWEDNIKKDMENTYIAFQYFVEWIFCQLATRNPHVILFFILKWISLGNLGMFLADI